MDAAQTISVPGLEAPVTVVVDRWGIPHIRAGGLHDLFLAQGFQAARDRLWQIDLWRKRGLGLLAADFGPGFLRQDRAARLFLFRGDMDAEWRAYAPDARAICTAFAAGVNAFVDWAEAEAGRLPPEFALMGTRPGRWAAEDVVRIRTHGLTRNAVSELLRTEVSARSGAAADVLRRDVDPPVDPVARADQGVLRALGPAALRCFQLATAPVSFDPARLRATLAEEDVWSDVSDAGEVVALADMEGSNNWAVAAGRTATGRPILASDPHRAHAIPSLRTLVHLTAPGFDAIGLGEPSSPGLCMGHNGVAAFGLTIFPADQEDVYVYPAGGLGEVTTLEEVFVVRGAAAQTRTLRFTRHGPVVAEGAAGAVAVRSVWALPGTAAYLASLSGMRAGSLAEYRAAMGRWGAPSCNQVYADTSGTIARLTCGFVPRRSGWDGLLPVPGDGRFEWDGVRTADDLPAEVDPGRGFVFSANENNLPADWDHGAAPVSFEWADPFRAARIADVLAGNAAHTLAASQALQCDVFSAPARRLCAMLREVPEVLRGWDHRLGVDSAAAALCELWWARHLRPAVLALIVTDERSRRRVVPGDASAVLAVLERPGAAFGVDPVAGRDRMLRDTLAAAEAECAARMGTDPAGWRWGALHHACFTHALSRVNGHDEWDSGRQPIGGSGATPMAAGYRPGDFRLLAGASVRIVVDVGAWDRSVCINTPGQSGDPRSAHYRDLMATWAAGEYVPMLYSRAAVDAAAEEVTVLQPG